MIVALIHRPLAVMGPCNPVSRVGVRSNAVTTNGLFVADALRRGFPTGVSTIQRR